MDLNTDNSNEKRNNMDNEKSAFERFEIGLKNTIFGVLFVLLKDEEMSIYGSFVIAFIQFIQILMFPFHPQVKNYFHTNQLLTHF